MTSNTDNPDRDRLEDLAIEESLGRNTPPDLRARILAAARGDDAPTPRRGLPSVPARGRTAKHTRGLSRKHWNGTAFVVTAAALIVVALSLFFALKPPVALQGNIPTTAEKANVAPAVPSNARPQHDPAAVKANDSANPPANTPAQPQGNEAGPQQPPEPQPEPAPAPEPAPEEVERPKPEVPGPTPEPKPEPKPEPGPAVEEPKPEPNPEPKPEGTEVKPEQPKAIVASMKLGAIGSKRVLWSSRLGDKEEWKPIQSLSDLRGVRRDPDSLLVSVEEGTQLKGAGGELLLANGALLRCDGVISIHTDGDSLRVELIDDDIYLDNLGCDRAVRVTRGELSATVGDGAAIFEAGRDKLEITCLDGEVSAGGKVLAAPRRATLNDRGLSRELELTARDLSHPLVGALTPRVLSEEDFDDLPAKGLIKGKLATVVENEETVTLARDEGRDAQVALEFDAITTLLPGQMVRVRFRQTGAEKMILQFWNPDKADNFGIDLPAGKPGEWQVVEVRIEKLLDRETAAVAAKAGDRWQSGGVYAVGKETKLEVDWIEFVRLPEYGK